MKLATIHTADGTQAARLEGDELVALPAPDVRALLAHPDMAAIAAVDGPRIAVAEANFAPVVVNPQRIVCVGLNYANHIKEMGRDLPEYPTIFSKYPDALTGAFDDIPLPPETEAFDWEVELAVIVGASGRRLTGADGEAAIAGFATLNDVTVRDWQYRTKEWTQGKAWEKQTPLGPYLVTPDEVGGTRPALRVTTRVDGEIMQDNNTAELVFDPVRLVEYISTFTRLQPGDVIATGTPGGVGHARKPPVYLHPGSVLETEVEGVGAQRNRIVEEQL
ncbi:2-hydroxyhepta-2,4-diene-1,7-dioate isomerase [Enemella evansiae]|uniref:fumarylacetoacetate hydrolase family protein n=1 Tax=Enemella evansiae TaxID=2016499 RepID=UPI000B964993|nr:fumarylacetoacetate hydrolase family protein [Enemella evansiae]OYO18482.1 2-hydroxyhepta-2,4-diene-1,7-dioate isomerase [Enemella evansiae]